MPSRGHTGPHARPPPPAAGEPGTGAAQPPVPPARWGPQGLGAGGRAGAKGPRPGKRKKRAGARRRARPCARARAKAPPPLAREPEREHRDTRHAVHSPRAPERDWRTRGRSTRQEGNYEQGRGYVHDCGGQRATAVGAPPGTTATGPAPPVRRPRRQAGPCRGAPAGSGARCGCGGGSPATVNGRR